MMKDLTEGKASSVLWRFSIPMFVSVIFQQLYNIADSAIAGKFAGESALAAVGASYPITMIFMAVAVGSNIGCSVVISQLFGAKRYTEMKNTENQVTVLGNSVGFIIAVLAVLNYLNTIAASVQNRSREFAALESIGMTAGQIRKMLRTEGIGYAVVSIFLSFITGLPVSYIVFDMTAAYRISFTVPWMRNLILLGIVLILCMAAPVLIYQRTQGQSIIERLRSCED